MCRVCVRERGLQRAGGARLELWRLAKDGRQLRCVAFYMPTGIDLRPKIWGFHVDAVEAFRTKLLGTRRGA
jgi:hypothetical protein